MGMKKVCTRCKIEKELSEFSKNSALKSGLLSKCKTCDKEKGRRYYLKKKAIKLEKVRRYSMSKQGRLKRNEASKKYYAEHKEQSKARSVLNQAVKSGKVNRYPCTVCGNEDSHGHHEDYSKPLEVIWLCRKCHTEFHNKKMEQARLTQSKEGGATK